MASTSHRSLSPLASRSNPNPRTPNCSIDGNGRRSFSGNPFCMRPSAIVAHTRSLNPTTPANSPSDFGRRSLSKENAVSSRDYKQKENERDSNEKPSVRLKSPAASGGTKNFMSPTISAASKFAESPKRKILAERNDAVRTSLSSSFEGKGQHFGSVNPKPRTVAGELDRKAGMDLDLSKSDASSELTVTESDHGKVADSFPDAPKKDPTAIGSEVPSHVLKTCDSDPVTMELNVVGVEAKSKTGPSFFSSEKPLSVDLAPLDVDPSLPPYDPKSNYLSPRPRFLHYRPNPRIELYLNKEREVGSGEGRMLLEDHLASECFLDTESAGETESQSSQDEYEAIVSSVEYVEEVKEVEEEEAGIYQPKDVSQSDLVMKTDPTDVCAVESITTQLFKTVEARRLPKRHASTRPGGIPFLLILAFTCLSFSVTDSPKDHTFPEHYRASNVINSDGLMQNFQLWSGQKFHIFSTYSTSVFSKLNHILTRLDDSGPPHYGNATALPHDLAIGGYLEVHKNGINERGKEKDVEFERELEIETGPSENELQQIFEAHYIFGKVSGGKENDSIGPEDIEDPYKLNPQQIGEETGLAAPQSSIAIKDELRKPQTSEIDFEVSKTAEQYDEYYSTFTRFEEVIKNVFPEGQSSREHENMLLEQVISAPISFGAEQTKGESGVAQNSLDSPFGLNLPPPVVDIDSGIVKAAEHEVENFLYSLVETALVKEEVYSDGASSGGCQSMEAISEELYPKEPEDRLLGQIVDEPCKFKAEQTAALTGTAQRNDMDFPSELDRQATDIDDEVPKAVEHQDENDADSLAEIDPVTGDTSFDFKQLAYTLPGGSLRMEAATLINHPESSIARKMVFSLFVLTTVAAVAIRCMKGQSTFNQPHTKQSYMSCPADDMVDELSPEFSSIQKGSYSKRVTIGEKEAQSLDGKSRRRNYRRESLASSMQHSTDSPSYGSFTTYEKIICKHGEEEIVTPVRRSSRLRNPVTSPRS